MSDLKHKVALVTGGASGIGKAIALRFLRDGADVVITDVQASLGEAAATELGCGFLAHDVTEEDQWSRVVQVVCERHGGLHLLVNNAGVLGPRDQVSPEDTRLSDWRRIFAVNVEGVFLGCRATIQAIHASGGGSIINISSVAGLLATPYATAYGASKAAVRHLTKSVAQHCAENRLNVRCNSVHPGIVRTPLWDGQASEAANRRGVSFDSVVEEARTLIPMGELSLPEDVAAVAAFLASDADSRHMTGAKLIVDGGGVHCDTYHMRANSARRAAMGSEQGKGQ